MLFGFQSHEAREGAIHNRTYDDFQFVELIPTQPTGRLGQETAGKEVLRVIKRNEHDFESFKYVLSDYTTNHGIDVPSPFQKLIFRKWFRRRNSLDSVCALRFGKYLLLISDGSVQSPRMLLFMNPARQTVCESAIVQNRK